MTVSTALSNEIKKALENGTTTQKEIAKETANIKKQMAKQEKIGSLRKKLQNQHTKIAKAKKAIATAKERLKAEQENAEKIKAQIATLEGNKGESAPA